MSQKGTHDRLAHRLACTLILLNQGSKLTPKGLADKFNVSVKTARRDLDRLDAIGLQQDEQGRYFLPSYLLGKLTFHEIDRLIMLSGIKDLFPETGAGLLHDLFDHMAQNALLSDAQGARVSRCVEIRQAEAAVAERRRLDLRYRNGGAVDLYAGLAPYKVLFERGAWYLVAADGDQLKTFHFDKIRTLVLLDTHFQPDPAMLARIQAGDNLWSREALNEVLVAVDAEAADYFKRRTVLARQHIVQERADGSLVVSTEVIHPSQILPIVRYWIPHVRILDPQEMQVSLERQLRAYVGGVDA
ncbi:hypothetical protein GCM10007860_25080 [Chitiniphilus shinanonensis]|uniref:Transcriptional regulator-like protein n=1 Tax=Chitiniphilus shinanonensis TaxID=553088 RepID=F8WSS0_9NEIS|nr:WYL domain-containing protein [Chitiniphilus shinanonensis]BAK53907.1 transcriptional regulator-like protein [Chitiniphilus shinanonensis]GLS05357.1 hypothetical protein GCM10007860_25080 [Chitiniphilus shinanonensis]